MNGTQRKAAVIIMTVFAAVLAVILLPATAEAAGWVEDMTGGGAEYARYPLERYLLDFYVDTSGDWLPWNWGEGISNNLYSALI